MKLLIKFFVVLTAVFCVHHSCFASPIPAFCMYEWIENCNVDRIREYDSDGRTQLKVYERFGSGIYEYDSDGRTQLKVYKL